MSNGDKNKSIREEKSRNYSQVLYVGEASSFCFTFPPRTGPAAGVHPPLKVPWTPGGRLALRL